MSQPQNIEMKYINFSYKTPSSDIEDCTGLNSDGSVNIKYTLMTLRDKLMENVEILNKLLEKSDSVSGVYAVGYDTVAICINSKKEADDMMNLKLIRDTKNEIEDDEYENSTDDESDHETHSDRLRMMSNLIVSSQSQNDILSDTDTETESDVMDDIESAMSIICKYNNFVEDNDDIQSDTD